MSRELHALLASVLLNLAFTALAFAQCIVFALFSGELGQIYDRTFVTGILTSRQWFSLLMNGGLAFGLNVVSFTVCRSLDDFFVGSADAACRPTRRLAH